MTSIRSVTFALTALGAAGLLAGCATPEARTCTSSLDCAPGQQCIDSMCRPSLVREDAGAAPDSPPPSRNDGGAAADVAMADASCGGEAIAFERRPPNVLVIFDRSCSMRRVLGSTAVGTSPEDPGTRWYVARGAVEGLMARFSSQVFWGLMAFPDSGEACGMDVDVDVEPGPGTAMAIHDRFRDPSMIPFGLCGTPLQPGVTPTMEALRSAAVLPSLHDPARESFAILVTDGAASCGATDDDLASLAMRLRHEGTPVAVVGFGTGGRASSLEAIAASGGLANPAGPESYYVAETGEDLDRILDAVTERVVSCAVTLSAVPADPGLLFVNANDVPLESDAAEGWSYEAAGNVLRLNGASCMRLQRGEITRLSVSFGCPPAACVPQPEICNGLDEDCDGLVDDDCLF